MLAIEDKLDTFKALLEMHNNEAKYDKNIEWQEFNLENFYFWLKKGYISN